MHSTTAIDPDALLAPVGAAVDELAVLAAEGRVRDLSHDQLSALVAGVRREQARLEAVLLTAVGEVDARGSHVHDGALSSGAWLRMRTNATPHEATGTVRTARVLRSGVLPETAAALAAGDISPQHARVITSGVADAPAAAVALIEREAVEAARSADVRAAAGVMKAFQHALDPDDADAAAVRRYERAGITLTPTLDGSLAITGTADEVSGATLATAVDAASPLLPGDRRTAARRRLDGLVAICRRYLASPDAPRTGRVGHPHVIVTVDAHTLAADASAAAPGRAAPDGSPKGSTNASVSGSPGATLSWIGRIAGSTARRLGCSSLATIVAIGPDGRVVEAGSQRRFFTAAQRRAIIARDGDRCCAPYCDRPITWADGHHLIPVEQRGPTTVDNGALPCEGHHLLVHEGHWRLERLPDGRYLLRHRDGRVIGPEAHPPGHNRPPPNRRT